MPKQYNKTEAFAYFGAVMDNVRWSWSGISEDGNTVVIVLWQDGVKFENGIPVYRDEDDLDAEWRQRTGSIYRSRHLRHAMEHCGGKFRAVIAKVRDVNADPREIESCFPQKNVIWTITSFDDKTDAFTAYGSPVK